MKRKLFCFLCVAFLVITLSGCKLETVQQHNESKDKTQETTKKKDTKKEQKKQAAKTDSETKDDTETSDAKKDSSDKETAKDEPSKTADTKQKESTKKEHTPPKEEAKTDTAKPTPAPTPTPAKKKYVTISIDAKTILNNMDKVKENKRAYVPADGWILYPTQVEINDGDTVFTVLEKVTRTNRIHMEYQGASQNIYGSVYIQGIHQLYEFDCGELSGWMYSVNGAYVSVGASASPVYDGQVIRWMYTCDLGKDLSFN